jgi:hypothetical protein
MKNIIFLILGIFLIGLVSASGENIGTYKFNTCVKLPQVCSTCSYSNISSVLSPNGTIYAVEQSMTQEGTFYYYEFCDTTQLGDYQINGHFDVKGSDEVWNYKISITPSGTSGSANTAFFIFVILLIYGITLVGYLKQDYYITILGSMGMLFLGIYLFNNGIMIFRDDITRVISYITIGLGALISIVMGIIIIDDNM